MDGEPRFDEVLVQDLQACPEKCAPTFLPLRLLSNCFRNFSSPRDQQGSRKFYLSAAIAKQPAAAAAQEAEQQPDDDNEPFSDILGEDALPVGSDKTSLEAAAAEGPTKLALAVAMAPPEPVKAEEEQARKKKTVAELWAVARAAVLSGEVRKLPTRPE